MDLPQRHSIRLKHYDYTQPGAYFVTLCTHNKACLFGKITQETMQLNALGQIVAEEWKKSADIRDEITLDEWVIMPNHFHGVVWITGDPVHHPSEIDNAPIGPASKSLGALIGGFKSAVTTRINTLRQTPGNKIWQRNYWEHVVRNESQLQQIREYIRNNPAQWAHDKLFVDSNEIREPLPSYHHHESWMV